MSRRVVHVISTPAGLGGAERTLEALVRGAEGRGWDAQVLNPFAADPGTSAVGDVVGRERYRGRRCASVRQLLATRRWLDAELTRLRPDVVHVHLFHAAALTATLRRRPGTAVVFSHHHGDHFDQVGYPWRARIDRWTSRRSTVVAGCSESVSRYIRERYGLGADRVVTISNGWSGTPSAHVGGPAGSPTIVCVARLRPQKGHDVLLRAFAGVLRELPSARLVLAGDGPLLHEVTALAQQLGLARSVAFPGAVDDVWPLLAAADVFALASRYEPQGIAVLEAMAAGLPVVATAVGGIPEVVRDGVEGHLVAPDDPAALQAALLGVLTRDAAARRRGADAALARAHQFSSTATVDRYHDLYDRLAT